MVAAEVRIVLDFHDAVNAGEPERLRPLLHDDVEVGGTYGGVRGIAMVEQWFGHAALVLVPRRVFRRGEFVVAEQDVRRRDTGDEPSEPAEPQVVASVFRVIDGRIEMIHRYRDLGEALGTVDVTEDDEVTPVSSTDTT
ncbi:nuclear transport factor 2 family protein [Streptoalloteichus hindustanus]|uniref:SnoaL-like domain-containing protein n=1 Tax=Streptoalloteichus hindustanus TaxID=2017 RepID=A0A1M5P4W4_STRHI|nr:nuclear transport factor 2 family protein [Streptoalloteichus hindustanus]SHG96778.1 SnoaL-like domain-containing protein [Streptoalloteichus hindustanus]